MSSTKATTGNIGTIDAARLTGAALPAMSGAALTNIPGVTNGAGDPLISTNPSAVGAAWLNTTTGELFCCTDATAGSNVWVNVGSGSGGYEKPFGGLGGGTISGFVAGGYAGNASFQITKTIEQYSLVTDGNKSDHGDLIGRGPAGAEPHAQGTGMNIGNGSATHGYASGGEYRVPAWTHNAAIDKFAFASTGTATDQGDMVSQLEYASSQNSLTHGYITGGYGDNTSPTRRSSYQRFSFASTGNATDVGTLITGVQSCVGQSSNTHGYKSGGYDASNSNTNVIERFSFASNGATTDVGDLTEVVQNGGSASSSSYGYVVGGSTGSVTDRIDKFSFTSNSNANSVGNITSARIGICSTSSVTHGYVVGGNGPIDTMQKWAYASDGTASNIGTLTYARQNGASSQF